MNDKEFGDALVAASRRRYHFLQGLTRETIEDLKQETLLWCWEHRIEALARWPSIELWFGYRLRSAMRKALRAETQAWRPTVFSEGDAEQWFTPGIDENLSNYRMGKK